MSTAEICEIVIPIAAVVVLAAAGVTWYVLWRKGKCKKCAKVGGTEKEKQALVD